MNINTICCIQVQLQHFICTEVFLDPRCVLTVEPMPEDSALPADLQALQRLANKMDRAVKVPGLPIHLGLDAVLGLLPGVGDAAAGAVSSSLLVGAIRHRVPLFVIAQMGFWIVFDILLGVVPIAGDFLDVLFQSNTRNMDLILKHRDTTREPRSVPAVVGVILAVLLGLCGISVAFYGALVFGALAAARD